MIHLQPVRRLTLPGLVASTLLIVGACAGSGTTPAPSATTAATPAATTAPAATATPAAASAPSSITVGTGTSASLGTFLTGPNGFTLYTLSSDPMNGTSCTGSCATFWPPLIVASGGSVTGASGVTGTLATFSRPDGTTQVTYNGHALYYFKKDTAPGQTKGQGVVAFGGTWLVVPPAGSSTTVSSPPPSSSSGY